MGAGVTEAGVERLVRSGLRRRFYPDGLREARAMYRAALFELIAQHRAEDCWQRLLRLMSGGLNDFPRLADRCVREQVRRRRRQLAVEIPSGSVSELQEQLKVRLVRGEIERPFAEVVMRANLTTRERAVIELRARNLPQAAVADRLGISQARVHQLEQAAIRKLQRRAQAHDLKFSSAAPYIWTLEIPFHR